MLTKRNPAFRTVLMTVGCSAAASVIAYDASDGERLWERRIASAMTSPIWPTPEASGRIVVFGLPPR